MSRVISKVLSPAMQFWLRSQVEEVETLDISIQGSDRQILKGHVSGVTLNGNQAIYQGLHLGEVQLKGENIRINIGQVLRGKPLQLLETIRVSGAVAISNQNLQASISSALLGEGFKGLLETLLEHQGISEPSRLLESYDIDWHGAYLDNNYFILQGNLTHNGVTNPLNIKAKLTLIPPQTLQLSEVEIQGIPDINNHNVKDFSVDLGSDVSINSFQLDTDKLVCEGELLIRP